jgi:hypothetical protein
VTRRGRKKANIKKQYPRFLPNNRYRKSDDDVNNDITMMSTGATEDLDIDFNDNINGGRRRSDTDIVYFI